MGEDGDDDEAFEHSDEFKVEAERLRELGRLRDESLLSEEEFTLLKEGLLGRSSEPPAEVD